MLISGRESVLPLATRTTKRRSGRKSATASRRLYGSVILELELGDESMLFSLKNDLPRNHLVHVVRLAEFVLIYSSRFKSEKRRSQKRVVMEMLFYGVHVGVTISRLSGSSVVRALFASMDC